MGQLTARPAIGRSTAQSAEPGLSSSAVIGWVGAAAFVSGVCGLSYQIIWQELFAAWMGSGALGAALVIALFLLGLAIGNELGGRYSLTHEPQLLIAAASGCEIFIGGWSLAACLLLGRLTAWSAALIGAIGSQTGADIIAGALLVLAPTTAMGAVIPLLAAGVARVDREAGAQHAALYRLNTSGAMLGCLVCGCVILPAFGIRYTLLLFAACSFGTALILRRIANGAIDQPTELRAAITARIPAGATVAAFVGGATVLTLEIAAVRWSGFSAGSSHYIFSLVVAAFLLMASAASFTIERVARRQPDLRWARRTIVILAVAAALWIVLLFVAVPAGPYLVHVLRTLFPESWIGWFGYHAVLLLVLLAALGPAVIPLSAIVPLLVARLSDTRTVGFVAGSLWRSNSLGCVFGVLVGGYAWFTIGSLETLTRIVAVAGAIALTLVLFVLGSRRASVLPLAASAVIWLCPAWDPVRTSIGVFYLREPESTSYEGPERFYASLLPDVRILAAKDDPHGRIAVAEYRDHAEPELALYIDGKPDGNTRGDSVSMRLFGHLPALLAPGASTEAAVIGFGTGMTAGALTLYPNVSRVDIFEISPAVREFASLFDRANHGLSTSTKVAWVMGDAYRNLLEGSRRYGIIASQPSTPWMVGIDRLNTAEFFSAVREALSPGGLYVHWFPIYDTSAETLQLALDNLAGAFDEIQLFRSGNDLVALAWLDSSPPDALETAAERFETPSAKAELESIGIRSFGAILAREVWLPLNTGEDGQTNSLFRNRLGYLAAKDFFFGRIAPIDQLVSTREDVANVSRRSVHSLFARYLTGSLAGEPGEQLVVDTCGDSKVQLVEPSWRMVRSPCRELLLRGMIEGWLPIPNGAEPQILLARRWIKAATDLPPSSVEEAERETEMFLELYSGALPLDSRRLRENLHWCLTLGLPAGQICARHIAQTLELLGLPRDRN